MRLTADGCHAFAATEWANINSYLYNHEDGKTFKQLTAVAISELNIGNDEETCAVSSENKYPKGVISESQIHGMRFDENGYELRGDKG